MLSNFPKQIFTVTFKAKKKKKKKDVCTLMADSRVYSEVGNQGLHWLVQDFTLCKPETFSYYFMLLKSKITSIKQLRGDIYIYTQLFVTWDASSP